MIAKGIGVWGGKDMMIRMQNGKERRYVCWQNKVKVHRIYASSNTRKESKTAVVNSHSTIGRNPSDLKKK